MLLLGGWLLLLNGAQLLKGNAVQPAEAAKLRTADIKQPHSAYYTVRPAAGDNIGSLIIPDLGLHLPVYEGTDKQQLRAGVGHYTKSVLPGEHDNSILSGHNDSVFSRIHQLRKNSKIIVQTAAGSFTYHVQASRIVDKEDRSVIVSHHAPMLTLTTCYPFWHLGDAPKRYVVTAALVHSM